MDLSLSQPRAATERSWTRNGRGASLASQRPDFELALRQTGRCHNSGLSTVYVYLRDKDSSHGKCGSPYYIGVACYPKRPYAKHGKTPVPVDERCIRILRSGLTHEQARQWERFYIAKYGRKDIGSGRSLLNNLTSGGDGTPGAVHTDDTRNKISAAKTGKPRSPETIAKMSAANKGKTLSAETRAKQSASLKGRKIDEAARANMSKAQLGKVFSDKHRANLSAAKLGKKATEETKAKLSLSVRSRSAETFKKTATANLERTAKKYGVPLGAYVALTAKQRANLRDYLNDNPGFSALEYFAKRGWSIER